MWKVLYKRETARNSFTFSFNMNGTVMYGFVKTYVKTTHNHKNKTLTCVNSVFYFISPRSFVNIILQNSRFFLEKSLESGISAIIGDGRRKTLSCFSRKLFLHWISFAFFSFVFSFFFIGLLLMVLKLNWYAKPKVHLRYSTSLQGRTREFLLFMPCSWTSLGYSCT